MMTMYVAPYRRLANLREAMDRMMEETMQDTSSHDRELLLAVDVSSQDDVYTLRALVPGVQAEDLEIDVLNNTVTIHGEFVYKLDEKAKFLTSELPQGRFGRVITLPVAVDASHIEANLTNGVLTLRIPKAEAHRPKSIKINTVN